MILTPCSHNSCLCSGHCQTTGQPLLSCSSALPCALSCTHQFFCRLLPSQHPSKYGKRLPCIFPRQTASSCRMCFPCPSAPLLCSRLLPPEPAKPCQNVLLPRQNYQDRKSRLQCCNWT